MVVTGVHSFDFGSIAGTRRQVGAATPAELGLSAFQTRGVVFGRVKLCGTDNKAAEQLFEFGVMFCFVLRVRDSIPLELHQLLTSRGQVITDKASSSQGLLHDERTLLGRGNVFLAFRAHQQLGVRARSLFDNASIFALFFVNHKFGIFARTCLGMTRVGEGS